MENYKCPNNNCKAELEFENLQGIRVYEKHDGKTVFAAYCLVCEEYMHVDELTRKLDIKDGVVTVIETPQPLKREELANQILTNKIIYALKALDKYTEDPNILLVDIRVIGEMIRKKWDNDRDLKQLVQILGDMFEGVYDD